MDTKNLSTAAGTAAGFLSKLQELEKSLKAAGATDDLILESFGKLVINQYEESASLIRKFFPAAEEISSKFGADLAEVIGMLGNVLAEVTEKLADHPAFDEARANRARILGKKMRHLIVAGFSDDQALQIILADINKQGAFGLPKLKSSKD